MSDSGRNPGRSHPAYDRPMTGPAGDNPSVEPVASCGPPPPDGSTDQRSGGTARHSILVVRALLRVAGAAALAALVLGACGGGIVDTSRTSDPAADPAVTTATTNRPAPPAPALPVDPAVTIGRLENGLTYYVRSNGAPGGNLELRLVVAAGSLEQEVARSGVAHFVEHMLFNGTVGFPGNTLTQTLEGFGRQVGADVNAYTTCEATVYSLSVALDGADSAATAFDVLDQWASAATIDPAAVADERGVVLEEYRTTETVSGIISARFDETYTAGSMYEDCDPIGTGEMILATDPADLRRFYDQWYRPDMMAVVAVGDLSVDRLEQEIADRFSDNVARSGRPAPRPRHADPITGALAEVIVHPDAPSPFVSIDLSLADRDPGTAAGERASLLDGLVSSLLQYHLDEQVAAGGLEIVRPFAIDFAYTDELRFLGFNYVAADEAGSVSVLLIELRTLAEHGFQEVAVERQVAVFQKALDQALAGAATRQDQMFADTYVRHFLTGADIDEATALHTRLSAMLASITTDEVSAHFADTMAVAGPLVIVVGHDATGLPSVAELEAAVREGRTAVLGDRLPTATAAVDSLMDTPEPVEPIEVNPLPTHDAVEFVYANGARVIAGWSEIAEGQVDLWAEAQGGWTLLAPGDSALVDHVTGAVDRSGVADLTAVQVEAFEQSTGAWLMSMIGETTEGFMGSARSTDQEALFALLHARITSPRVDGPAFAEAMEAITNLRRAVEADPYAASMVQTFSARYGGDTYLRLFPDESQTGRFSPDSALAIYESRLGDVDDLVIAIVGDTDIDTISELSDRYVGTLPRGVPDTWLDLAPQPPTGIVTRAVQAGANDASAGFDLLIVTAVEPTERLIAAARVVERVLETRLFATLREELAMSYSGAFVSVQVVEHPLPLAVVYVSVDGNPTGLGELHARTLAEIADLATGGTDPDEFERARSTVLVDLDFVTNGDLLKRLIAWGRSHGADSATVGDRYDEVMALSLSAVSETAALLLPADRRIEVFRTPGAELPAGHSRSGMADVGTTGAGTG